MPCDVIETELHFHLVSPCLWIMDDFRNSHALSLTQDAASDIISSILLSTHTIDFAWQKKLINTCWTVASDKMLYLLTNYCHHSRQWRFIDVCLNKIKHIITFLSYIYIPPINGKCKQQSRLVLLRIFHMCFIVQWDLSRSRIEYWKFIAPFYWCTQEFCVVS